MGQWITFYLDKYDEIHYTTTMTELSWHRVQYLADMYEQDTDLERDLKFEHWIKKCKYRIISAEHLVQEREYAMNDNIEVLIIKEK